MDSCFISGPRDADAIDVFNALADTKAQEHWDELLMNGPGVTYLGDFAKEKARGAAVSFVARPFPDRQAGAKKQGVTAGRSSSGWPTTQRRPMTTCLSEQALKGSSKGEREVGGVLHAAERGATPARRGGRRL